MSTLMVLLGGKSAEHEGSVLSYKNIINNFSKDKYSVLSVAIDKNGKWWYGEPSDLVDDNNEPEISKGFHTNQNVKQVFLKAAPAPSLYYQQTGELVSGIDLVFPMLHGSNGEDGAIQGFLQIMSLPYIGCEVLASAICMNKVTTKVIASSNGIPVAKYLTLKRDDQAQPGFTHISNELKLPFFIKPANLGSSVAARTVSNEHEFHDSLATIFTVDTDALAEELIIGTEISCLTTADPEINKLAVAGLMTEKDHLTNYDKLHSNGSIILKIPADIDPAIVTETKRYADILFRACSCKGAIRVDFFVKEDGQVVFSEINTMPGLSYISIAPKILASADYPLSKFLDYLIKDAESTTESQLR